MKLRRLQKIIETIGTALAPEEDWMPTLILEGKESHNIFGFVGDSMGSQEAKDRAAEKITELIVETKPMTACFITTAWSIAEKLTDEQVEAYRQGILRPSKHPRRIEIVSAYCYGDFGENEGEAIMMGRIQRFKTAHPKIKKWTIIDKGDLSTEGRFPEAIREGFKLARGG